MSFVRKKPLRRTSFKRGGKILSIAAGAPKIYSTIKKKAKRKREGHNQAMLDVCRDQPCYLLIPGVCLGTGGYWSVVPCHANEQNIGKGMGLKVPDKYTVPGCRTCHAWLDAGPAPRLEKQSAWRAAYREWSAERDGVEDANVATQRV